MEPLTQIAARKAISEPRLAPYIAEAQKYFGDQVSDYLEPALKLYSWASELSGQFQTQISYVEVATRNAICRELSIWNSTQNDSSGFTYSVNWTKKKNRHPYLTALISDSAFGKAHGLVKSEKGA